MELPDEFPDTEEIEVEFPDTIPERAFDHLLASLGYGAGAAMQHNAMGDAALIAYLQRELARLNPEEFARVAREHDNSMALGDASNAAEYLQEAGVDVSTLDGPVPGYDADGDDDDGDDGMTDIPVE